MAATVNVSQHFLYFHTLMKVCAAVRIKLSHINGFDISYDCKCILLLLLMQNAQKDSLGLRVKKFVIAQIVQSAIHTQAGVNADLVTMETDASSVSFCRF